MGRVRTNPKALEEIAKLKKYIYKKNKYKNNINIEIGCGKGDFLCQIATNNIKNYYVGIEKIPTIILKAIKKININNITNVRFLNINVLDIKKYFKTNSINNIYINFPDPWPKKRHEKYRLLNKNFLDIYYSILKKDGNIFFKTDNDDLYKYANSELENYRKFNIIISEKNIYTNNELLVTNIQTEYEKKFITQGKIIKEIILKK